MFLCEVVPQMPFAGRLRSSLTTEIRLQVATRTGTDTRPRPLLASEVRRWARPRLVAFLRRTQEILSFCKPLQGFRHGSVERGPALEGASLRRPPQGLVRPVIPVDSRLAFLLWRQIPVSFRAPKSRVCAQLLVSSEVGSIHGHGCNAKKPKTGPFSSGFGGGLSQNLPR
jgi:hypothetical protein